MLKKINIQTLKKWKNGWVTICRQIPGIIFLLIKKMVFRLKRAFIKKLLIRVEKAIELTSGELCDWYCKNIGDLGCSKEDFIVGHLEKSYGIFYNGRGERIEESKYGFHRRLHLGKYKDKYVFYKSHGVPEVFSYSWSDNLGLHSTIKAYSTEEQDRIKREAIVIHDVYVNIVSFLIWNNIQRKKVENNSLGKT